MAKKTLRKPGVKPRVDVVSWVLALEHLEGKKQCDLQRREVNPDINMETNNQEHERNNSKRKMEGRRLED